MLLLLKSPASGTAAATLGITLGLTAVPGTTAIPGIALGLTPPESIELNIFVTQDIHFGLTAISSGFVTRSATLDTRLDMQAIAGFGAAPAMDIHLGLSGTVGSFLQAVATPGIVLGLTAAGTTPGVASLSTVLDLSGSPNVSGGTVTPSASLGLTMSLAGAPVMLSNGVLDTTLGLAGAAVIKIPNLATDMRLSFSTDEIRLFFRKG